MHCFNRDQVLAAMLAFHRLITSRLGAVTAAEWLHCDLTSGQLKLLFWLTSAGEQPMSHIARALGVSLPTATSVVDRLVEAGILEREHSPIDRRVVLVRASRKGQALAARLRQINEDEWRRIIDQLSDDETGPVYKALQILTRAAQAVVGTSSAASCPEHAGGQAPLHHEPIAMKSMKVTPQPD